MVLLLPSGIQNPCLTIGILELLRSQFSLK
jgi:hypothetical protein